MPSIGAAGGIESEIKIRSWRNVIYEGHNFPTPNCRSKLNSTTKSVIISRRVLYQQVTQICASVHTNNVIFSYRQIIVNLNFYTLILIFTGFFNLYNLYIILCGFTLQVHTYTKRFVKYVSIWQYVRSDLGRFFDFYLCIYIKKLRSRSYLFYLFIHFSIVNTFFDNLYIYMPL